MTIDDRRAGHPFSVIRSRSSVLGHPSFTCRPSETRMTDLEVYALIIIALAICFANWRVGVLVCVAIGFLQDPVRKVMPGEPVFFTALVGAPLVITLLGAHVRKVRISFRPINSWNNVLRTPLTLFIFLVLIQSIAAGIKTGNPMVAGIGALSYLAPLPAVLLGYQFSRSGREIVKVARSYLLGAILMTSGVYLAYAGYDWKILKQVGEGLFIYSQERGRLDLFSGFFRSPEIAAWHAATAVCLLVLLSLAVRRNTTLKLGAGALVVFLLGAILLTGRRKFLVEIFLFALIYFLLLIWFRRTAIKSAFLFRSAVVLASGLAFGAVIYMYAATDQNETEIRPYYERGVSVRNDVTERVSVMTLESFQYVIEQNGLLGSGAGTGSQGVQHFGGTTTGASAEGGLAKVLAELGIPGLLLLLWVTVSLARYMWSIIRYITDLKDVDPSLAKLIFGLVAFLLTNGFVYVIAHQVFGDPFILIILGFFTGFIVAMPKMLRRKEQRSEVRSQRSEVRSQRSEVRSQRSEVRSQKSEVRSQRSEIGSRSPVSTDF